MVVRHGDIELPKEYFAHVRVVMLASVNQHFARQPAKPAGDGSGFHKLGPGPDYGYDFKLADHISRNGQAVTRCTRAQSSNARGRKREEALIAPGRAVMKFRYSLRTLAASR